MNLKLSERERWLAILAVAALAFYFFYSFFHLPISTNIREKRENLKQTERELALSEEKLKLLQSIEEGDLEKFREKKSKQQQTIEAIKYLSDSFNKNGIDLVSIKPRPEEIVVDAAKAIYFDIEFVGTYPSIYRFIKEIDKLPILILVDSIKFKKGDKGKITASMVLSTYY